jgi:aryl-alcohol dehydrogenase-like predicted oxidoreductase
MEKRRMGALGPEVSVLGLGCNNFGMKLDEAQSREVVEAALAAGVTHFDTAESYGGGRSEEYLGAALGGRRDQVVIATKFAARPEGEEYHPGALRRRIMQGARPVCAAWGRTTSTCTTSTILIRSRRWRRRSKRWAS